LWVCVFPLSFLSIGLNPQSLSSSLIDSEGCLAVKGCGVGFLPFGAAFWPQPLPSSQAPAGNTFLGLVARFSAPGVSSPCPCLKKSIQPACGVLENPYLCARLRSHKMELNVAWKPEAISASFFVK